MLAATSTPYSVQRLIRGQQIGGSCWNCSLVPLVLLVLLVLGLLVPGCSGLETFSSLELPSGQVAVGPGWVRRLAGLQAGHLVYIVLRALPSPDAKSVDRVFVTRRTLARKMREGMNDAAAIENTEFMEFMH